MATEAKLVYMPDGHCSVEFWVDGVKQTDFNYHADTGVFHLSERSGILHISVDGFTLWVNEEAKWRADLIARYLPPQGAMVLPRSANLVVPANAGVPGAGVTKVDGTVAGFEFKSKWRPEWNEIRIEPRPEMTLSFYDYEFFIGCHKNFLLMVQRILYP